MKQAELTVAMLMAYRSLINGDLSSAVVNVNGVNYTAKAETHYIAGWLTSGQKNGEILISSNKPEVGKRSLDGNMLPAGVFHLIEGVRCLFDTSKAAETDANLLGAIWANVAPVEFKNGEVTITQGSELFRSSGTDVTNFKASTGNDADYRAIVPSLIRPQTKWSINFALAGGAAPANAAFKWEYRCITFTEAGKS